MPRTRRSGVSSSPPASPEPELVEDPAAADGLARLARELLEQLALFLRQLARHLDIDQDVQEGFAAFAGQASV